MQHVAVQLLDKVSIYAPLFFVHYIAESDTLIFIDLQSQSIQNSGMKMWRRIIDQNRVTIHKINVTSLRLS